MNVIPHPATQVVLDRDQAAALARLLREMETFLDECDDDIEDAMAAHFGLNPASDAYAAAICFHADALEAALGASNGRQAGPSAR